MTDVYVLCYVEQREAGLSPGWHSTAGVYSSREKAEAAAQASAYPPCDTWGHVGHANQVYEAEVAHTATIYWQITRMPLDAEAHLD